MGEFWPFVTAVSLHAHLVAGRGLSEAHRVEEMLRAPFPPPGFGDNVAGRATLNTLAITWLAGGRVAKAERVLAEHDSSCAELVPARLVHALLTGREEVASE